MRALIFNSGLGSRLGELTRERPKSLVRLGSGETIFHRQLRILSGLGMREFVVTTGPYPEMLRAEAAPFEARGCTFEFVANERYAETNYIWSMRLADPHVRGRDCLVLHGDLVFDAAYVGALLAAPAGSLGTVAFEDPLPEKDFKARIDTEGRISEVSVGIFDRDCRAFQPFYRLTAEALGVWLDEVALLCDAGETGVYAENAANRVFGAMRVRAFSCDGHVVGEVDTPEDLARMSEAVRLEDFAQQPVYEAAEGGLLPVSGRCMEGLRSIGGLLSHCGASRPLVVCGRHVGDGLVSKMLGGLSGWARFSGFSSNPTYGQALAALAAFHEGRCDSLLAVGGGSAVDIAKCVKAFSAMPEPAAGATHLDAAPPFTDLPLVAVPTTAGTGSESTHFAVVYLDGVKHSLSADFLQPTAAVLDAGLLATLPEYQRKCALLDALCQAVESYWSRKSCPESRAYSAEAVSALLASAEGYLAGDEAAAHAVLRAANLAGKAINLTTTTAPHAMSYKLSSLRGIPHGHAVALCMPGCWRALIARAEPGGALVARLAEVAAFMTGGASREPADGLVAFDAFVASIGMGRGLSLSAAEVDELASSVNAQRLSNFPLELSREEIGRIYEAL